MIALGHIDFGVGTYYSTRVPWLTGPWPFLFPFAAVVCMVAAVRFSSRPVAIAGALTVTAYASRAGVFLIGMAAGLYDLDLASVALGCGVWIMLTVFAAVVWLRAYGPLVGMWARSG